MSKTSQRRQSLYKLGYEDAVKSCGHYYRWSKHPLMSTYKSGFNAGLEKIKSRETALLTT